MSADNDDQTDSQLRQYINHLLIEMHESQRQLIQARFVGHGDSRELRSALQSEIVALYWTLKPYRNRASNSWSTTTLYERKQATSTQRGREIDTEDVEGLDHIAEWDKLEETHTVESDDFTSTEQTVTEPKILPREVLVPTATAIAEVADRIGFNAADPNMDDMDENPF